MNIIERNNAIIRWFNDFRTGYVRLRICERCFKWTRKNHWSKKDEQVWVHTKHHNGWITGKYEISYGHIWLCHECFYKPLLGKA